MTADEGTSEPQLILRQPLATDGLDVHRLIANCPPLDPNSSYCNLLQCTHFASTSVAAELNGSLCGFISGYQLPMQPGILFIWQVAVGEQARGRGLAGQMIRHILMREANQAVRFIQTTITADNEASWALFRSVARKLDAAINHQVFFDEQQHFEGQHESELLVEIGPFQLTR